MCVEFGEVTVIIGLVINFLAFRLTIVRISWHLNIYFDKCFETKSEIFFLNIFPNLSQFSEFEWDNDDGDVGGDDQFWDPKLTETIPNIY